jgi:hypothetical protein
MKSHGSPTELVGLRLMEVSPTSPTTLEGGTSGTTQAGTALDSVLTKLKRLVIEFCAEEAKR